MGGFLDEFYKSTHKSTNGCKRLWFSLLLIKLLSIGSPAEANNIKSTDSNLAKIELEKHNTARVDGNLWYTPLLTDLLSMNSPAEANTNKVTDNSLENIEQKDSTDIIWNIERDTWIKFPASYREKFYDFLCNNPTMKDKDVRQYTIDFIKKKLSEDWWIDKSNQFGFIWSAVVKKITDKPLYKNNEEEDQKMREDYERTAIIVFKVGKAYAVWLVNHLNSISEEAITDSKRLDEENKNLWKENKKLLEKSLGMLRDRYNDYKRNPDNKYLEELIDIAKKVIPSCNEYGIDYTSVLSPEARKDLRIE